MPDLYHRRFRRCPLSYLNHRSMRITSTELLNCYCIQFDLDSGWCRTNVVGFSIFLFIAHSHAQWKPDEFPLLVQFNLCRRKMALFRSWVCAIFHFRATQRLKEMEGTFSPPPPAKRPWKRHTIPMPRQMKPTFFVRILMGAKTIILTSLMRMHSISPIVSGIARLLRWLGRRLFNLHFMLFFFHWFENNHYSFFVFN